MAVLTAFLMSLTLASAASAHSSAALGNDANYQHDDANGVAACATATTANPCATVNASHAATHPGSGAVDSVDNDSPADAVNVIRDYGLENAPIIIGVIGAIFLVGLTFYLVRRGLMKARGAMRL